MNLYGVPLSTRSVAVIIEDDPLTLWSLKNLLEPSFDVLAVPSIEESIICLKDPRVGVVICGSPTNGDVALLKQIAERQDYRVIALVSDVSCALPSNVTMIEKPFALERITDLLKPNIAEKGA